MKSDPHWIEKAAKKMKEKGTEGSFTKSAKKAGMGVSSLVSKDLSSKSKASPIQKKRAQFAKNVSGL